MSNMCGKEKKSRNRKTYGVFYGKVKFGSPVLTCSSVDFDVRKA
jgi:hypothetical protein